MGNTHTLVTAMTRAIPGSNPNERFIFPLLPGHSGHGLMVSLQKKTTNSNRKKTCLITSADNYS
jgi:hypothetical protein